MENNVVWLGEMALVLAFVAVLPVLGLAVLSGGVAISDWLWRIKPKVAHFIAMAFVAAPFAYGICGPTWKALLLTPVLACVVPLVERGFAAWERRDLRRALNG